MTFSLIFTWKIDFLEIFHFFLQKLYFDKKLILDILMDFHMESQFFQKIPLLFLGKGDFSLFFGSDMIITSELSHAAFQTHSFNHQVGSWENFFRWAVSRTVRPSPTYLGAVCRSRELDVQRANGMYNS